MPKSTNQIAITHVRKSHLKKGKKKEGWVTRESFSEVCDAKHANHLFE